MKALAKTILALVLVAFPAAGFAAEGVVTLWSSGSVVLSEHDVATFKTYYDESASGMATIQQGTNSFSFSLGKLFISGVQGTASSSGPCKLSSLTIAGPATISLTGGGLLTLDVQPTPTSPEKTAVVAAYSGHVKVTMENSTDLVNWAPVPDGVVYTNSPDARFLRIKMEKVSNP